MYAILELSGRQYKVTTQDVIEVNRLASNDGDKITFEKVLLVAEGDNVEIGQPYVKGASVEAEVLEQTQGKKVFAYRYLRRKDSHKKTGHRQKLTKLKVLKINN